MKTLAFFNNRAGVGTTSLVYHLAWMYADLGLRVVAADLDPQADLTTLLLTEDRLEELWPDTAHRQTIYGSIQPLLEGTGDGSPPHVEPVTDSIGLLVGDLALSAAEDELSALWLACLERRQRALRVISSPWRAVRQAAEQWEADLALINVGPSLGAINRTALLAAESIVIPLAPDLYSLQGLKNLGPTLRRWRGEWEERKARNPLPKLPLPAGLMNPIGYVVMQHAVRLDRPVLAYDRWLARIPQVFRDAVFDDATPAEPGVAQDPYCVATLRHYRSLMPLAQEARKPMFALKPADGAVGGHAAAVRDCYRDFRHLAEQIAVRCGLAIPSRV